MSIRSGCEAWHRRLVQKGPARPWERGVFYLLSVLSLFYGGLLWVRERLYLSGAMPRYRAAVPVISVGNLAVGGTGKTPVTDLLIKRLLAAGVTPAVVSRGYGRKADFPVEVVGAGAGVLMSPHRSGDEPYLLARRNPQALVVVAARRAAGVAKAVELGAEVVVLDDGFQHLAVARDFDLVLLDAETPLGNGFPLPAGLLREFPSALRRADILMLTRSAVPLPVDTLRGLPLVVSDHQLADEGWDLQGKAWSLAALKGKKVAAFCGIATPENFFAALAARGVAIERTLALPDHSDYEPSSIRQLVEHADGMDFLLTTEKDAVKLLEAEFPCPCIALPLELRLHGGDDHLNRLLQQCLRLKDERTMTLSEKLLEILACPACKGAVSYQPDAEKIVCPACKLAYPVRDEIPVMLIDEAEKLEA